MSTMNKIALEEHFLTPAMEEYWAPTVVHIDQAIIGRVYARLVDFGDSRLDAMDRAGIERSVLSLTCPGVQREFDGAVARRRASEVNDALAREIGNRPGRYSGFAHLALQDPAAAGDELARCVRDLGFCGALINGHTNGEYLDDPKFYPFWERAEEIGAPIYLHPADPLSSYPAIAGCDALKRATWEWGGRDGFSCAACPFRRHLRSLSGSEADTGHLGEPLPYLLSRFDTMARTYGMKLKKRPSEYIREHMFVTTSGMFSAEPLACAMGALGAGRVMFSVDYPYESADEAATFIENVSLGEQERSAVCYGTAERLLGLGTR
ncbi:MAG TPA: amidohydrolase family protein [Bryobacteraceae bacterium]|nr:amidohydrolase family protein [Bryobacteraceae bacterium]